MVLSHLGHLASSGHQVFIRTGLIDTLFPIHPKIEVKSLEMHSPWRTLLAALSQIHPNNCTIIAPIIPLALLLRIRNKGRVVYFAQDNDEACHTSYFAKLAIRFAYFLGLRIFKIPTIAVSNHLAQILRDRFAATVEVVLNGIDQEIFYYEPLPQELKGNKSILMLSRHDYRKGFDIAVKAIQRVAKSVSEPFEVWTVGENSQGMFDGVIHRDFGYIDENQLRRILSSATLFLYPSRHEGFGLMVAEAFACLCPVVTTEAVPYAKDGINAFVSKVDDIDSVTDNVCRILDGLVPVHELVEEGYRQVSLYSLKTANVLFEQCLIKLIGR